MTIVVYARFFARGQFRVMTSVWHAGRRVPEALRIDWWVSE